VSIILQPLYSTAKRTSFYKPKVPEFVTITTYQQRSVEHEMQNICNVSPL
jgi:hypothetical protein